MDLFIIMAYAPDSFDVNEEDIFKAWLEEHALEEDDAAKELQFRLTEAERKKLYTDEARLFTTPETVFILVHTHGSILLDKAAKTVVPFHLPKDVLLYQLNAQVPGVKHLGQEDPKQELEMVNATLAEAIGPHEPNVVMQDPVKWYDGLKALPEDKIEAVMRQLQARFKAYNQAFLPKNLKYANADLQKDLVWHANKSFQLHKFDHTATLYDKIYSKRLHHMTFNTLTILNKFRQINDVDEEGKHVFLEPFEYFRDNYDKTFTLQQMIQDLVAEGAKRIAIIDLSCASFSLKEGITDRVKRNWRRALLLTAASQNKIIEPGPALKRSNVDVTTTTTKKSGGKKTCGGRRRQSRKKKKMTKRKKKSAGR